MTYMFKLARRMAGLRFGVALFSALTLALTACEDSTSPAPDAMAMDESWSLRWIRNIELTPDRLECVPGDDISITATPYRESGETAPMRYISFWVRDTTKAELTVTGRQTATVRCKHLGSTRVVAGVPRVQDSSEVEITQDARPRFVSLVLSPGSVSLLGGATQQFSALGKRSDGTTAAAAVSFAATGGSITSSGLYTAGPTPGTFRVIATESGGTLVDTASVTVTAPPSSPSPPPPSSGKTFFLATAESGNVSPWSWTTAITGNSIPSASQTRPKHGGWAYKYEITNATMTHSTHTLSGGPQISMGSPNGRYLSGYYSVWLYVDAGYTDDDWTMLLGWMTGKSGAPDPISHTELRLWRGVLQVSYVLKNCAVGLYPCPNIPGYESAGNQGGYYFMTPQSPAGVKPFPRNQWVHLSMYYKMAPTNGQVKIWQDGTLIMDLTAPSMNTFGGHALDPLRNSAGDMMLQFGIYGGPKGDGVQRLYADDFMVTDFRPMP